MDLFGRVNFAEEIVIGPDQHEHAHEFKRHSESLFCTVQLRFSHIDEAVLEVEVPHDYPNQKASHNRAQTLDQDVKDGLSGGDVVGDEERESEGGVEERVGLNFAAVNDSGVEEEESQGNQNKVIYVVDSDEGSEEGYCKRAKKLDNNRSLHLKLLF